MTIKLKALAAFTAVAVSGIAFSGSAQAAKLTTIQKIEFQLPAGAVLENPAPNERFATDAEFAQAVVNSTTTSKVSVKLSPKAAVQAAFQLAVGSNATYRYASTTILTKVSSALAKSSTKLTQALSGAFTGFSFTVEGDAAPHRNSQAAALVDSSFLGIKDSGLTGAKLDAAYVVATKAAVKGAAANSAAVGASVGAAAQFIGSPLFSTIIKSAVSKASNSYEAIAAAIATATKFVVGNTYSPSVEGVAIRDAVVAGYAAAYAATHGGVALSKNKKAQITALAGTAVTAGEGQTSGAGATGLDNYNFVKLQAGPVTDIYGL